MKVYAKESTKLAPIKNGIELPHFFVSMSTLLSLDAHFGQVSTETSYHVHV